jgi:hypothetical protein
MISSQALPHYATPQGFGQRPALPRYQYSFIGNNCQDYVDSVIERAWKKAKKNNDSLTF